MKSRMIIYALSLGIGLSACEKVEQAGTSRMNVRMTDAPGDYDSILLNVKEVEIISSAGRTTIAVNAGPFDILSYRNGKDTLIASQDIPSGRMQEIRLVLHDEGNRIVVNGQSYDLETPSGQSSGVKIKVQEELVANVAYTLLLDFDAAQSIVLTGNGKYILKPVIRAIPQSVSGAITGIVSPAMASTKVYAITGTDTIGTLCDANGVFWFSGVAAGTYKVNIDPMSPYLDTSINNVVVSTGVIKDLETITLP